jgi:hypothetical protein
MKVKVKETHGYGGPYWVIEETVGKTADGVALTILWPGIHATEESAIERIDLAVGREYGMFPDEKRALSDLRCAARKLAGFVRRKGGLSRAKTVLEHAASIEASVHRAGRRVGMHLTSDEN